MSGSAIEPKTSVAPIPWNTNGSEKDNPLAALSSPPTTTAAPKERKIRLVKRASVTASSGGRILYQGGAAMGWDLVAKAANRQTAKKTTPATHLRIESLCRFRGGMGGKKALRSGGSTVL